MGYRDEGEAAMHRVASLEQQIVDLGAQVTSLQQSLSQANAEIVRLRGNPIAPPASGEVPAANVVVTRVLVIVTAAALVALIIASASSESGGMAVATGTVPICGATIAAWVQRRRPLKNLLVAAAGWGFFCFVALLVFFATIWRSL